MKETQTSLRTLWTINSLLEGTKNQKQITQWINKIDQQLKNNQKNITSIKTTKATLSPIIKELNKKEIITIEYQDVPGTNLKSHYCTIPNNLQTFVKIIKEIENSTTHPERKKYFINYLTKSELGETQINEEILPKLLKKQNRTLKLNNQEKDFVTKILKESPQALNYTINSIENKSKEWKIKNIKEYYFYMIQTLLNLDLLEKYPDQHFNSHKTTNSIKYKTEISFEYNKKLENGIKTDISSDKTFFLFIHNIDKFQTKSHETIENYILTYG